MYNYIKGAKVRFNCCLLFVICYLLIVICYFKPVAGSWKPVRHKIYLVWPYLRQKELDTLIHLYEEYEEYEVR